MAIWLLSANAKKYDHQRAFSDHGYVLWRQMRNYQIGDSVYIYCTMPIGKIQYYTIVERINVPYSEIQSEKAYYIDGGSFKESKYVLLRLVKVNESEQLSYSDLKKYQFIAPQGPQHINDKRLYSYIKAVFEEA